MLIAAATLAASCATPPPPSPLPPTEAQRAIALQHATEDVVANYIYAQLNADPVYYYRHVNVSVDEGVATLTGYVWDTQAIYRARRIVGSVPGVTRVVTSGLELERNGRNSGVTR
jgi:osmotically-inducible protein OsmY